MINFRKALPTDSLRVYEWRKSPQVARYMSRPPAESFYQHDNWFSKALSEPSRELYIIQDDKTPVGLAQLYDLFTAPEFGFYVAHPDQRHRGVGKEALRFLINRVFKDFDFETLHCKVNADNYRALNLYLKAGFKTQRAQDNIIYLTLQRGDEKI